MVVARLDDDKLATKLAPLVGLPEVEEVALVRRTPLALPGVTNHCPPRWLSRLGPPAELWRLLTTLRLCARDTRRTYAIAFYLIPHALYIELARRLFAVRTIPVSLSQMDLDIAFSSRLLLAALRGAHAVGVRGPNSARRLAEHGIDAERIFAPPNVFDVRPAAAPPRGAREFDAVYVGSLVAVKQVDLLLEAWRQVVDRRPRARLAIVGDGELRRELEARSARLGLRDNVVFAGAQPPDRVASWLDRGRLFVLTSAVEGLPMAMIEALDRGVPVVVPRVGDIDWVARHGENAWMVSPTTAEEFAHAIGALLDDPQRLRALSDGALRSRDRFAREFSAEAARAAWRRALGVNQPCAASAAS